MSAGLPDVYKEGLVLFTTRTCSICNQAKSVLRAKGVHFQEVDITYDENAQGYLRSLNLLTVPQFFLDDEHLPGGLRQLRQRL